MSGAYPPLDREQVETILRKAGFSPKKQGGTSHQQWEGRYEGKRRIVTMDHLGGKRKEKYGAKLLGKMISQSGMSKKEFYALLQS